MSNEKKASSEADFHMVLPDGTELFVECKAAHQEQDEFFREILITTRPHRVLTQTDIDAIVRHEMFDHESAILVFGEGRNQPDEIPPLYGLESLAKWLSKDAYEVFIEPHVLDIRRDCYKAKSRSARKWIIARGYWNILKPLFTALWTTLMVWLKLTGN